MKTNKTIIYGAAAVALTGLIIFAVRLQNTRRRVAEVADEGYETAADILHPKTNRRFRKLHYGPVLPDDRY